METNTVSNEISNKAHNSYLPCRTIRALGTFRYDVDNSKLSEDFVVLSCCHIGQHGVARIFPYHRRRQAHRHKILRLPNYRCVTRMPIKIATALLLQFAFAENAYRSILANEIFVAEFCIGQHVGSMTSFAWRSPHRSSS